MKIDSGNAHLAAALQAGSQADILICREPRIMRRILVFLLLSLAIVFAAAWHTNEETNYWWKISAQRTDITSVDIRYTPVYLRTKSRMSGNDDTYRVIRYSMAGESNTVFFGILAVNIVIYLAAWTPEGAHLVTRYLLHSGLSGRTYTTFTAVFCHTCFSELMLNSYASYPLYRAIQWIADNEDGVVMWNFPRSRILAFYTISGVFGHFLPTLWAQIFFRRRIHNLPPGTTVLGALRMEFPCGLRMCQGAAPALCALHALFLVADDAELELLIGPVNVRSLIIPGVIIVPVFLQTILRVLVPNIALHHLTGYVPGIVYCYFAPQFKYAWEITRTLAGNRHTMFGGIVVAESGRWTPVYRIVISETALRLSDTHPYPMK
ncbi:hypothetical protein EXIGLDRAFT_737345 [Exidia glandulosa HHB12029]|uniref:Uncharacterized protein n=1 Tax=Exidia glandulosa HHB12029 TaxID=1314781 RepID=A0A165J1W3_EXIGL|nr:hypothetical protein EXIGLDRAFT_737345 [Exidia glandulosa HHB12029]